MVLTLVSCDTLVIDPSANAMESNDWTLVLSACGAVPGGGMDICRVTEGTATDQVLRLIVPHNDKFFLGGEGMIYFKGRKIPVAVTDKFIEIPWSQVLGENLWKSEHDGEALILVTLRFKNEQGVEEVWKARGIAKVIVLKPGYSVLPIDSGYVTFEREIKVKCKVQYTTAGRSAVDCKPWQ